MMNLYVLSQQKSDRDNSDNSGSTCTTSCILSVALRCIAHLAEGNPQTVGFYYLFTVVTG